MVTTITLVLAMVGAFLSGLVIVAAEASNLYVLPDWPECCHDADCVK